MRPRGEIRVALSTTLERLVAECGAVSSRQLAAASQVGLLAAQKNLNRMVEAGEVVVVGTGKDAATAAWFNLYEPAAMQESAPQAWGGIEALNDAVKAWAPPDD